MISLSMTVKSSQRGFFDRPVVTSALDRVTHQVFSRFGGYVRKASRSNLKHFYRGPSEAPNPPHSHTGLLRDFIYYTYDRKRRTVVIGPVRIRSPNAPDIPRKLELGGAFRLTEVQLSGGFWVRPSNRRATQHPRQRPTRVRMGTIEARPFMAPAFQAGLKKLPDFWVEARRKFGQGRSA